MVTPYHTSGMYLWGVGTIETVGKDNQGPSSVARLHFESAVRMKDLDRSRL